jgi:hypothetical protein
MPAWGQDIRYLALRLVSWYSCICVSSSSLLKLYYVHYLSFMDFIYVSHVFFFFMCSIVKLWILLPFSQRHLTDDVTSPKTRCCRVFGFVCRVHTQVHVCFVHVCLHGSPGLLCLQWPRDVTSFHVTSQVFMWLVIVMSFYKHFCRDCLNFTEFAASPRVLKSNMLNHHRGMINHHISISDTGHTTVVKVMDKYERFTANIKVACAHMILCLSTSFEVSEIDRRIKHTRLSSSHVQCDCSLTNTETHIVLRCMPTEHKRLSGKFWLDVVSTELSSYRKRK